MKDLLNRMGAWILTHPRLVTALVFIGLAVAAFAVMPALGVSRPRWKP